MKIIGVDVGGTFTDIVLTDTQTRRLVIHKVASTAEDPSVAVMRGILEICEINAVPPADIAHVFHGTTVATNAVLQHRGATAGMITTAGYRDILHIGRHQRPQHYSIRQGIPWQDRPLVRRRHRKTVVERLVPPRGDVRLPLDEEQVRTAARELRAAGVESIAICFLFSYLNPVHEARARAIVEQECPGLFVTTSSEVSPQFREFERFTTAAMNAFIGPLVCDYVRNLEAALRGADMVAELHVMCSNGGVATPSTVSRLPVLTLMSGLAAGVMGGAWVGALAKRDHVITLDIGGTSADIGVVTQGRFAEASARDTFVGGYPIMVPMIDLHTIGAGGGSIAFIDEGGSFKVGPHSAGAVPGPAAYGFGGVAATVTDANLVLGRLDKDNFLGGAMQLDANAATAVVRELAERLGLTLAETAEGIIAILNANMANAIRARTVQKGIDPRDYALVASGGAGPLHGAEVARMLGIREVIVPPFPGASSAMGLLTTDLKYDAIQTAFLLSTQMDYARLNGGFTDMEERLRAQLQRDRIDAARVRYERYADVRYIGQGYELRVSLPVGEITPEVLRAVLQEFHALHRSEYGHMFPDAPVEFVNIRVTGIGATPGLGEMPARGAGTLADALVKRDQTIFRVNDSLLELQTSFYRRDALPLGQKIAGPAVIVQVDSTTIVPPECAFSAVANGLLVIDVGVSETPAGGGRYRDRNESAAAVRV
ncbi:MAG: hydantoinase/oxoprolinase family protein [Gammaproteobacteria bacterium]|nr:hydantoinase/oxoprolinase family protein [Gammaproteobacteria bacterium]